MESDFPGESSKRLKMVDLGALLYHMGESHYLLNLDDQQFYKTLMDALSEFTVNPDTDRIGIDVGVCVRTKPARFPANYTDVLSLTSPLAKRTLEHLFEIGDIHNKEPCAKSAGY